MQNINIYIKVLYQDPAHRTELKTVPTELDKSAFLRAARLDDLDNAAGLQSVCTGFTSCWLAMVVSEDDSTRDVGLLSILEVEFIEGPIIELFDGCSVLNER